MNKSITIRRAAVRKWPVRVTLAECDDAGNIAVERVFIAHWRPFTEAEHSDLVRRVDAAYPLPAVAAAPATDEANPGKTHEMPALPDIDYFMRRNAMYFEALVVGWGSEVVDEAGAAVPFSVDALRQMLTGPDGRAFGTAFNVAVNEIRFGGARKNSPPARAPGPAPAPADGVEGSPAATLPTT